MKVRKMNFSPSPLHILSDGLGSLEVYMHFSLQMRITYHKHVQGYLVVIHVLNLTKNGKELTIQ